MECRKIQEMLTAYVEGMITSRQTELVRGHLASCLECSAALDDVKKTEELLKSLDEVEPPPWLTQKIMAHVREEAGKKSGILSRFFYPLHVKIPVQVLGMVLVVGMVAYLYKTNEPRYEAARVAPAGTERALSADESRKQVEKPAAVQPARPAVAPPEDSRPTVAVPAAPSPTQAAPRRGEPPVPASHARDAAIAKEGQAERERREYEAKRMDESDRSVAALSKRRSAPAFLPSEADSPRIEGGQSDHPRPVEGPPPQAYRSPPPRGPYPYTVGSGGAKEQVAPGAWQSKAQAGAESKAAPPGITGPMGVTVQASDVPTAAMQVENILRNLGARNVMRESLEGRESVSADLKGDRLNTLFQSLNGIGYTRPPRPDFREGNVAVRIEIAGE